MPTIDLPIGPVDYRIVGPRGADSPVAVFVHGFLVNATLWDPVAEQLAASGVRCILPDWPLGPHRLPGRGTQPLRAAAATRGYASRVARGMHRTELAGSATWLGQFQGPVHLVWGTRDKHCTIGLGRRLAAAFRRAQLNEIPHATTFVSIDRPDAVVSAGQDLPAPPPGSDRTGPPSRSAA